MEPQTEDHGEAESMNKRMIDDSTILYLRSIENMIRNASFIEDANKIADTVADKITCIEQVNRMQFTRTHELLADAVTKLLNAEDTTRDALKEIHSILDNIGNDNYIVETNYGHYVVGRENGSITTAKVTHAKDIPS